MKYQWFLLCGYAVALTTLLSLSALADGELDPGFAPRIFRAGQVNKILVQSDGKILIAGVFKTVNGVSRFGIARLNADGSLDASFDASNVTRDFTIGTSNPITFEFNNTQAIAQQPDGRILVAVQSSPISAFIIRLNSDGSLDQSFRGPTFPTGFTFLLQPDGKILATTVGGGLIRLNPDGSPDSFAYAGPILQGGRALNGAIALQADGKILVAGATTNPLFPTSRIFLRVNADGSLDSSFNPGTDSAPTNMAIQPDGKIILFGRFSGTRRINPDGSLDPSFIAPVREVRDMLIQPDGRIVIAGDFTSYAGTPRRHIARINADGSLDSSFDPGAGTNRPPSTLARLPDGRILAGGDFYLAGDEVHLGVASFHPDGRIDPSFKPLVGGRTQLQFAALAPGGKIVIAGYFDVVNETVRPMPVRLNPDGTIDGSFAPKVDDGGFFAVAVQPDGKVLGFGQTSTRFFRLNEDGTEDSSFTPRLGVGGLIVLQPDGKILFTGSRVIRLNPDGTVDTTFRSEILFPFLTQTIAMGLQPDGKIIIAKQNFTERTVFRLNADGSLDSSFGVVDFPNGTSIRAMTLQPDGKILVGGDFNYEKFVLRLNSDGSPDSSFNPALLGPSFYGVITKLAVQRDGKVLVANEGSDGVIRLNSDGSRDGSLNLKLFPPNRDAGEFINILLLQPDGQLLVGGSFDRIGFPPGAERHGLARVRLGEASVVTTVSAASYGPTVAPDSIASAFGIGVAGSIKFGLSRPLPTILDGAVVKIKDSAGIERAAPLFFISPTQINLQVPPATAVGMATLTVEGNGTKLGAGVVNVRSVAPGIFTFNSDGKGVPAGYALRVRGAAQSIEPIHQTGTANRQEPRPIDLGPEGDQVWLVLFGTGIRGRTMLSNVTATIGGASAMVGFAGAQGDLISLDQVNMLIPRSLMGRGEVDVVLTVGGQTANVVKVSVK